jgi:hypothetical protein
VGSPVAQLGPENVEITEAVAGVAEWQLARVIAVHVTATLGQRDCRYAFL